MTLTVPVSSSNDKKTTPLAVLGRCRTSHDSAATGNLPRGIGGKDIGGHKAQPGKLVAEQGKRVAVQREAERAIFADDLLAFRWL